MDNKISEYKQQRDEGRKTLRAKLLKAAQTKHKTALKKLDAALKTVTKIAATLKEEGLKISINGKTYNEFELREPHKNEFTSKISCFEQYRGYSHSSENVNLHEDVIQYDKNTETSVSKLTDLKNEIRADIYGLEITYTEIRTELDKKIKTLSLA